VSYAELLERNGLAKLVADGDYSPVEEANGPKAVFSFAAAFAEVRVDEGLGQVRLNRFVGAYDAGQIVNPKLARSQAIGGITWGTGQALMEQSETDPNTGRFLHRNYSGYLVPTNADIPGLDIVFVGGFDGEASPLGAKGLGELTAVSVAPAIANAVYHATGVRVRDLEAPDQPEFEVRAKTVVAATGVWSDDMSQMLSAVGLRPGLRVRASKGVHLVVPRSAITGEAGLILRTPTSVLFVIPWGGHWIIGTTDTDWQLDRGHPAASARAASKFTRADAGRAYSAASPFGKAAGGTAAHSHGGAAE